jgi:hypothetical protein
VAHDGEGREDSAPHDIAQHDDGDRLPEPELEDDSAALAALSMGLRLSRTAMALIAGVVGYLATIYFVFQPWFAQAFDNWMISLLLWMSPWAGVVMTDFYIYLLLSQRVVAAPVPRPMRGAGR